MDTGCVEARRPDAKPVDERARNPPLGAVIDEVKSADEVGNRQRNVVLDAAQEEQRLGLPILRREAYSGGDGVGGAPQPNRPAVHGDRAGKRPIMAEDRLGQFRTAGADQPREADDFARTHIETDIVDARCREALHRKGDLAAAARSALVEVRNRPSDHGLNDFRFRKLRRSAARRRAARRAAPRCGPPDPGPPASGARCR